DYDSKVFNFFFQAEDGIRYFHVTGVQTCALPISIIDLNVQKEDAATIYTSLEDFLEKDTETDVVVIATPNGLHKTHAIRCLEGGKHVLIEKPIALNSKDAKEILAVAENRGKRVFSSMQLRFSPPVSFVKTLLENNSL